MQLLEREHEIERLRALLREGGGRVAVIEGSGGMGKSRLLGVAGQRAAELGFRVLSARGTELEQGFSFGVVRQLFERLLLESPDADRERWLAGAAAVAGEIVTGTPSATAGGVPGDAEFALQHGLYWLASNLAAEAPLALVIDDLQWCDVPSTRALAFMAGRLSGQPLVLIVATRPLDPAAAPVAATLLADPGADLLHPAPLTEAAIGALVTERLEAMPEARFVRACLAMTGGNPFLVGELLDEAAARGLAPSAAAAPELEAIVPRGVVNTVLLRLARLPAAAVALARALSALGDGAQMSDAARLAAVEVEPALAALVAAGTIAPGAPVRFMHPLLRSAIYEDLSVAERERLHRTAMRILRERGAPARQIAAHVMQAEPIGDPGAVALLRTAADDALALGDAGGAAALLARALAEPPTADARAEVLLELGRARARAGAPEAVGPLTEIVERSEAPDAVAAAAVDLSGMLFYAGRAAEGAAILSRGLERVGAGAARDRLDAALLGVSYTSASARREAEAMIADLRDPGGPATTALEATILATLALDDVMFARSAATAADRAQRALAAGLPLESHRGENWALLALAALTATDELDAALAGTDEILIRARAHGAAVTVVTFSALRAMTLLRRGDLSAAEADAQDAIELVPDLLGAGFAGLAVAVSVFAGLERGEDPETLRRLVTRFRAHADAEFLPSSHLRYASGVLRAAAGNHAAAIEELKACGHGHPTAGGENPAVLAWRSAAALSLAELGRDAEARELAADELRRAESFGAPRAIAIALRAQALVRPAAERADGLAAALAVLEHSPARLERARVLVELGATHRAAGRRTAAREPLLEGLAVATRCGAHLLAGRARDELSAIGYRPRTSEHTGVGSLTPSERRVTELAASGATNREIAQTLFVTEKTVETHLGRSFRKLDITSRRQLRDALASDPGA